MPAAVARIRVRRFRMGAGVLLGALLAVVVAAPASAADPVFAEGDCVVYRTTDAGPGGSQCAGVDLSGTRFGEGDFRGANLQGASFVDGDVQGAVFDGADLTGADFTGTRIVSADFTNSSILPGQLTVEADASGSAPVAFTPAPPTGITVDGCSIVDTPVESGQVFPIGTSNMLCTLSTSFDGAGTSTATARVTITVAASATATPTAEAPLFTDEPTIAADATSQTPNYLMIGGFAVGILVVGAGIAALVISNRRSRS
ncbi:pentapeptide repeat-containing protein [Herbiconiux sp. YIM B11900]|uniref:pentapeptide repeat-containing protein n=1 Tax=Herbiconiux sp. YIM B11900 TaxID=3404131 RepID=UPI003F873D51